MKIVIKDNVVWDTDAKEQSEAALAWMREENLSRLGMSQKDVDMIIPELDKFRRPYKWVIEHDTCVVEVIREYVEPSSPSWAMKRDVITVISKCQ